MRADDKKINSLLKKTQESVSSLNKTLKNKVKESDTDKECIEFIIQSVCDEFNVSRRPLMRSTLLKFREPRDILVCILYFELGLPIRTVSRGIFKREHFMFCFKAIKKHKNLDVEKIKPDREYKEKYDKVLSVVKPKINNP